MQITDNDIAFHNINYRLRCIDEIAKNSSIPLFYKEENFDCDDRENKNLSKFLKEIGCKKKIKYIKSGSTGHTFCAQWQHPDNKNIIIPLAIKVVAYRKKGYKHQDSNTRPENAELHTLLTLSKFVQENITPHLIIPLFTFKAPIEQFIFTNKNSSDICENFPKKYNSFLERYEEGYFHDNVSIIICEWSNGGDLSKFLKQYGSKLKLKTWIGIFFQIIATLAAIQEKYPDFRHNDLKANNILVTILSKRDKNYYTEYFIGDKKYIVPCIGITLKIWDFDFACIDNIIINDKVNAKWTSKLNINSKRHRYYDFHYFFNTLISKSFYPELMKIGGSPPEIQAFINRVLPEKYRKKCVSDSGRFLRKKEYLIPQQIIEHDPLFQSYRC